MNRVTDTNKDLAKVIESECASNVVRDLIDHMIIKFGNLELINYLLCGFTNDEVNEIINDIYDMDSINYKLEKLASWK